MRRTYRFPNISIDIESDDRVNPEIHLFNSYDVTWPFIVLLGAFRFVCANGLVIGRKVLQVRKRHVLDLDKINLEDELSTALDRFQKQAEEWKKWANLTITEKAYGQIMDSMNFGKKASEEIEVRVDREAEHYDDEGFPIISVWIFFNVLTWYITHRCVSLNHRVEMERRLRAAIGTF